MTIPVCSVCGGTMREDGFATQVYQRDGATLTVTGIPAVRICTRCNDAVLEWEVAQQVQDLVEAFFTWVDTWCLHGRVLCQEPAVQGQKRQARPGAPLQEL